MDTTNPSALFPLTTTAAWGGRACWRLLDAGVFDPARFLQAWQDWRDDPHRPRLLHVVAFAAWPLTAPEWLPALPSPLQALGQQLAAQWWGLVAGMHRLSFEEGQVTLTLCVGPPGDLLREQSFTADAVWLDGQALPDVSAKALARLCRRGTLLAARGLSQDQAQDLRTAGFQLAADHLQGRFDPAWTPKTLRRTEAPAPTRCVVVGGGLAGASVARALALRGWQVEVLDAAPHPAAGASGLPAGLLVPHLSPDDGLLSRLSRAGVRTTVQQAHALLREGLDWQGGGVLEHRVKGAGKSPRPQASRHGSPQATAASGPVDAKGLQLEDEGFAADWSRPADPGHRRLAGLPPEAPAVWHGPAAWIKPGALVRAWLDHPDITWRGGCSVARIERRTSPATGPAHAAPSGATDRADQPDWLLYAADGTLLATAPLVVVAAALGSAALASGRLWLQAVRGQVSWGPVDEALAGALPACTVNGNGHLLPRVPTDEGPVWMTGATYGRGDTDLSVREADHGANLSRLEGLLPDAARALAPVFATGQVRGWTGVRCASHDRRPLVGPLDEGLWTCTAMGSRGLTFAALSAQLLAARLHDEPLPLPLSLAGALDLARQTPDRLPKPASSTSPR